MKPKYTGPIESGMVFTCADNEGVLGFRRIRIVAQHIDGDWLFEDLPSQIKADLGVVKRLPETNLRIVFYREEPTHV